jgi:nucleoside 2-deoxyribosyltransferase
MSDWDKDLSAEDKERWDEFVTFQREQTMKQMMESAFVMSIVPEEADIKFAVELGLAIMLDKPLFCVLLPGAKMPPKLEKIADMVTVADLDTKEGREALMQQIFDFQLRHGLDP